MARKSQRAATKEDPLAPPAETEDGAPVPAENDAPVPEGDVAASE